MAELGTTACKWDAVIPFEPLWKEYKRIIKPNGAIVLTASQPFTSALVMSNPKMFKHHWIWDKVRGVGFQVAKYRPMMKHEDVVVFNKKTITYNPQMVKRDKVKKTAAYTPSKVCPISNFDPNFKAEYTHKFPTSIIEVSNASQKDKLHPTQKPVALFEYLIKTYSNENDVILDNTAGSGTTGVAAINTGRNFILMEKEPEYYEIAKKRIEEAYAKRITENAA